MGANSVCKEDQIFVGNRSGKGRGLLHQQLTGPWRFPDFQTLMLLVLGHTSTNTFGARERICL